MIFRHTKHRCLLWLTLAFLAACTSDGSKEPPSKLEYLNGEKYRADIPVSLGGLPVVTGFERVNKETSIKGRVHIADGNTFYQRGLRFENVVLLQGDKRLAVTTTDENGAFTLQVKIADGAYRVAVESKRYKGSSDLSIKGYSVEGVEVQAKPLEPSP